MTWKHPRVPATSILLVVLLRSGCHAMPGYHMVVAHDALESHHSSLSVFWRGYEPLLTRVAWSPFHVLRKCHPWRDLFAKGLPLVASSFLSPETWILDSF